MNWLDIVLGIILMVFGYFLLIYELRKRKEYKRKKQKNLLARQIRNFLGPFLAFAIGLAMVIRAL